ncbi:hypothetical protein PBY51_022217 [Eleginops maclovinus]|uniref:Uncharacterized protein n=1 Tax=Eleginops maclovinus TaxID=56733 RepID=A0AAN8AI45_ELEMC|nr:hypothetical protein PBY51_022217 [Eleginops maclovinus]
MCSGLLFRAHTSYQSLRVLEWPTDISLTEKLTSGADGHHHFFLANFNTSQKPPQSIGACPAVNYHQLFVGRGTDLDRSAAAPRCFDRRRVFAALPLGVLHTGSSVPPLSSAPH